MSRLRVAFDSRAIALEPVCVVGAFEVARALAARVLREDDLKLHELRGVTAGEILLLLGAAESLPWVDGAVYLGRDPSAPSLLVPTRLRPDVPMDAFERAVLRHGHAIPPPIAVLVHPPTLVSVAEARPVDREKLRAWLGAPS